MKLTRNQEGIIGFTLIPFILSLLLSLIFGFCNSLYIDITFIFVECVMILRELYQKETNKAKMEWDDVLRYTLSNTAGCLLTILVLFVFNKLN